jgi:hypothetical protein
MCPVKQNSRMSNLNPQLLTWLICDGIHIDQATGKYYILGAFSHLRSHVFPLRQPRMIFFLTIAGLREGKHKLNISMGLPMEDQKSIVKTEFESKNPLQRINLINEMQGLVFEKPGQYAISIDIDDENLIVTTLTVLGTGTENN